MEDFLGIHAGKQIRNGDLFRTPCRTVAAGRTLDQILGLKDLPDSVDCFFLCLRQRREIFHIAYIIFHLLQHVCPVMERDSEVTDLSFLFQLQRSFISTSFFKEIKIVRALRVHQIEVEIIHAARLQLTLKKRTDVLFRFKKQVQIRNSSFQNRIFHRICVPALSEIRNPVSQPYSFPGGQAAAHDP